MGLAHVAEPFPNEFIVFLWKSLEKGRQRYDGCERLTAQPEGFCHCAEGYSPLHSSLHIIPQIIQFPPLDQFHIRPGIGASDLFVRPLGLVLCADVVPAPKGSATQAENVTGKSFPCIHTPLPTPPLVQYDRSLSVRAALVLRIAGG